MPPGKATMLLSVHLITGLRLWSELAQEKWFKSNHPYKPYWLSYVVIFEALFDCQDILLLHKSPIKWRQHSDMTIFIDWDAKLYLKQTK